MKKTARFLAMALAAAMAMSSCSKEGIVSGGDPAEVKFTGNLAQIKTRVGGADGTVWDAGDPVGVYMLKADPGTLSEGNVLAPNKLYTASAGAEATFTPDGGVPLYYPSDGGGVKFVAYHPHSTSVSADWKVPVSVATQTDLSAIDVLYAPATAAFSRSSTGAVPLAFAHKLTKLVFNVSNGEGVTEPVANGVTVSISGQQTAGTLDLADGTVAASGAATALTASGGATIEAIVMPRADLTGVELSFTNNAGQRFTLTVPTAAWQGGYRYTYTVTLKAADKQSNISGEIDPWDDGGTTPVTGNEVAQDPSGRIRMTLNPDGLTTRAGGGSIAFGVAGKGNVTIDWGDGEKTVAPINTEAEQRFPHTYAESAVYEVTVAGDIWSLDCSRSGLIGLDISAAPGLVTLRCSGNSLTDFVHDERSLPALDLSGDTAITELVINTANTTTLNLSGCTALVNLTAKPGSGASGALESLNVAGCTALEFIDCRSNRLAQVDLSTNTALKTLYVYSNRLTALDVARNTALESLWCSGNNNLTTLDVTQNSALADLQCGSTGITELDLSGNPELNVLTCWDNELGSLDLSANPKLGNLDCERTGLSELDLSHNPMMYSLDCSMNELTEIVFPEMEEYTGSMWQFLDCSDNRLTSLQIDRGAGIRFFDCSGNRIRNITQLTDGEIAAMREELSYMSDEQELERELARRIAERPLHFPELTVMNCAVNSLAGLVIEEAHSLETLVCSRQGYNPEEGRYADEFRLHLRPFVGARSLCVIDLTGNSLPEQALDELFSGLRGANPMQEPLDENAIATYRQINIGNVPYEGYRVPPASESGWTVTAQTPGDPYGGWGGEMPGLSGPAAPVLKRFPNYPSDMPWPYDLHQYHDMWNMAHGGVIWTRGAAAETPEIRRRDIARL